MNDIPPLSHRIVRVVIRMGGSSGDAALALGVSKPRVKAIARDMGLSFRSAADRRFDIGIMGLIALGHPVSPERTDGAASPRMERAA